MVPRLRQAALDRKDRPGNCVTVVVTRQRLGVVFSLLPSGSAAERWIPAGLRWPSGGSLSRSCSRSCSSRRRSAGCRLWPPSATCCTTRSSSTRPSAEVASGRPGFLGGLERSHPLFGGDDLKYDLIEAWSGHAHPAPVRFWKVLCLCRFPGPAEGPPAGPRPISQNQSV